MMNEELWATALMAADSTPGRPRDAMGAVLRVIASWVEDRGEKGLDLDPGETADALRSMADLAEAESEPVRHGMKWLAEEYRKAERGE